MGDFDNANQTRSSTTAVESDAQMNGTWKSCLQQKDTALLDEDGVVDMDFQIDLSALLQHCYSAKTQAPPTNGAIYSSRIAKLSRVETKDRGHILRTDVFLPKGTLLFRVKPLSGIPDADHQLSHCAACINRVDESFKVRCVGGCGQVVYCSVACRDKDHQYAHRLECKFLAKWSATGEHVTPRMVGSNDGSCSGQTRVMQCESRDGTANLFALDPYSWDYVRVLMRILTLHFASEHQQDVQEKISDGESIHDHNIANEDPLERVMDMIENRSLFPQERLQGEIANAASVLSTYQDWILSQLPFLQQRRKLSKDELIGLVCKEESNSFGLYDYTAAPASLGLSSLPQQPIIRRGYGLAMYADAQVNRFNHSCAPNLYHIFHGCEMFIYTGRDIQPKEELNIRYLELGGRTYRGEASEEEQLAAFQHRKKYLKDIFFFDCGCIRCQAEDEWLACHKGSKVTSSGVQHRQLSQNEKQYIQVGLTCANNSERECFGHYVPPLIQKIVGIDEGGYTKDDLWQCIACGHKNKM